MYFYSCECDMHAYMSYADEIKSVTTNKCVLDKNSRLMPMTFNYSMKM